MDDYIVKLFNSTYIKL